VKPRRVARPSVLQRIPHDRHAVLEASAGTGKTYTLEHLVIELLLTTDTTLDRVLVVTFTEKATAELRVRIRARIEDLLSGKGAPPTAEQIDAGDFWTIDDAAIRKLERAHYGFDAATIATIHAFCQRVLRENAFHSGRLFEEQQIDGREAFARAFRDALRRGVASDAARAAWLEMARREGRSIDGIEELLWSCVAARGEIVPVLRVSELERALDAFPLDLARDPSIVPAIQRLGVPAQSARAIGRRLYEMAEAVEFWRETRDMPRYVMGAPSVDLSRIEALRESGAPRGTTWNLCSAALDLAAATPPFGAALAHMILPPVHDELARRKREAGLYDFDDMLSLVDQALRGPRGPSLADAMRRRWRYALIDEFQDTDETQWSIFRRAFFEGEDPRSIVYLVGDPKQSIYCFRGADVQTYLRACDEIVASGGSRITLDTNYRATPALVDATNAVFDQTAAEPMFTGAIAYSPVGCGRPERLLVDGDGREAAPVHVFRFQGSIHLATLGARIAREIRDITDPVRPWRLDDAPLKHADIFVLTRTRAESRVLGKCLRALDVPHAFFKEDGLFQTAEASDLHAVLLAIDDPSDRARRLAAWLTPFFGLTVAALESARELPATHPYVARLDAWKTLADAREFGRLFESIVTESGILRREIFFEDSERELTNTLHILEILLLHARQTHATLRELIAEMSGLIAETRFPLDVEGSVQRLESERSAVQIMTIHKAKGLEAPVVFVAGGTRRGTGGEVRMVHEGGRRLAWVGKPTAAVELRIKEEEREEEQRLMYVALTRNKGRLYLPYAVDGSKAKTIRGPYEHVNRRLVDLARRAAPGLSFEDVGRQPGPAVDAAAVAAEVSAPPAALVEEDDRRAIYAAAREHHAAAIVTSYTRLKGSRIARAAWSEEPETLRADKATHAVDEVPQATLRAARSSGVFLHELLERVPLDSFAAGSFESWRVRPDVSALVAEAIAVHRVDPAQRVHAERLVWVAYTTPLPLPGAERIDGLARAARVVREMDFVYPIVGGGATPASRENGGYVRGSIDLAFEHRGITYFVDWKSDSLASYSPDALARHVDAHYEDQVKLYAIAVVKLLGVGARDEHERRFGGLLYCFLRGFGKGGTGVWSARPSWDDLASWQRELSGRRAWAKGNPS
jgi:exodeoxyribonuclease V beta subunit